LSIKFEYPFYKQESAAEFVYPNMKFIKLKCASCFLE